MPEIKFTILGELTDYNTYSNAQRTHAYVGAKIKKEETERVRMEALCAKLVPFNEEQYPLKIHFAWFCKNKRKDPDNLDSSKKFVLDGLQLAGILRNDGWGEVAGLSSSFHIDKEKPRVEITFSW